MLVSPVRFRPLALKEFSSLSGSLRLLSFGCGLLVIDIVAVVALVALVALVAVVSLVSDVIL